MTTGGLDVDELLSYAAAEGGEIRVTLRITDSSVGPGATEVRLTHVRDSIRLPAEVATGADGTRVSFAAPGTIRGRTAWRIQLRMPGGELRRVRARLLAAPDQPVALLPGPAPATRMAPPPPRPAHSAVRRLARRLPEPVKDVLRRGRDAATPS